MEFWGTFFFGITELFAITQTPKHLVSTVQNPRLLKAILFANVIMTFIPAVMVTINLNVFEIISHEIEYCSEITMSFLELAILKSIYDRNRGTETFSYFHDKDNSLNSSMTLATIALCISLIQLGIYNGMGRTNTGGMAGEVMAHHFEFFFETVSSLITCWFAMENMLVAEEELRAIMFGDHADCKICASHANLNESV